MNALMAHQYLHHHHHHHPQHQKQAAAGQDEGEEEAVTGTEYYYDTRREEDDAIASRSSRGIGSEANQNRQNCYHHRPKSITNPNSIYNPNSSPAHFPNLDSSPTPNSNFMHEPKLCPNTKPNTIINPNPNPISMHNSKPNNENCYQQHNAQDTHGSEDLAMMEQAQISVLALLLAAVRRSAIACHSPPSDEIKMDIGWPTDVQHVAHVTFDRFNGFLGLPIEFEVGKVPSASASVFGVSPESMQCSYDRHGNSVPTILLLLQERLYSQGGLKAEGIFRINAENSQEKHVRDQLNKGIVPDNIDVHCLAGLIKAWLRELPEGVLDSIPPELFLQCNTEEQCLALVEMLPPSEAALLKWVVGLMTDVVEEEEINKMNAHNIAMVFAPNMTQMSDPLTALMHAVQVMNFLKTLILKNLSDWKSTAHGGPKDSSTATTTTTTYGLAQGNSHSNKQCGVSTTSSSCEGSEELEGERQGGPEQDRYSLDVEERFFRGFSGRGANGDIITERLVHGSMQSCL